MFTNMTVTRKYISFLDQIFFVCIRDPYPDLRCKIRKIKISKEIFVLFALCLQQNGALFYEVQNGN